MTCVCSVVLTGPLVALQCKAASCSPVVAHSLDGADRATGWGNKPAPVCDKLAWFCVLMWAGFRPLTLGSSCGVGVGMLGMGNCLPGLCWAGCRWRDCQW
jgi:hypothetical protein